MKESDKQSEIMTALGSNPLVAWCMAVTTGKFKVKGGYITVGHYISEDQKRLTGMSDIIGQMIDGRFFGIEVKLPNEEPTAEQYGFMALVSTNKGISGWCTDVKGAINIINEENEIAIALTEGMKE